MAAQPVCLEFFIKMEVMIFNIEWLWSFGDDGSAYLTTLASEKLYVWIYHWSIVRRILELLRDENLTIECKLGTIEYTRYSIVVYRVDTTCQVQTQTF